MKENDNDKSIDNVQIDETKVKKNLKGSRQVKLSSLCFLSVVCVLILATAFMMFRAEIIAKEDIINEKEKIIEELNQQIKQVESEIVESESKIDLLEKEKLGIVDTDKEIYVYVTSSGTKMHKKDCPHIQKSKQVDEITREQALLLGYTDCKTCFADD